MSIYYYGRGRGSRGHEWTYKENYICCKEYLTWLNDGDYFRQRVDDFVNLVHSQELPNIKKSSIKMKFQNIQYLVNKYAPSLGQAITPLYQYSEDCEVAFIRVLGELFQPTQPPQPTQLPQPPRSPQPVEYKNVVHSKYGKGTVVELNKNANKGTVSVEFKTGTVKFVYPSVFMSATLIFETKERSPLATLLKKLEEEFE